MYRMSNNRHHGRPHREFFTLGEHVIGNRRYSFQYDGRTYRILEQLPEQEETILLEEADVLGGEILIPGTSAGSAVCLATGEEIPCERTPEGLKLTLARPISGEDTPAAVFRLL